MKDSKRFLGFDFTGAQLFTASQQVNRVSNCNAVIVTNTGDDIVRVNGQILYPGVPGTNIGDNVVFGGNIGEIYLGRIVLAFDGVGAQPEVSIIQKFYTEE